jgi:hypothetical protein
MVKATIVQPTGPYSSLLFPFRLVLIFFVLYSAAGPSRALGVEQRKKENGTSSSSHIQPPLLASYCIYPKEEKAGSK